MVVHFHIGPVLIVFRVHRASGRASRLSVKPGWRRLNRIYVERFRSIPLLVMILWVYYGLPVVLGLLLGPFAAGVVALSLCDSAFEAEIFWGGVQSIERGQTEAVDALGFSYLPKMRYVVLPQAVRRILPPLGIYTVLVAAYSCLSWSSPGACAGWKSVSMQVRRSVNLTAGALFGVQETYRRVAPRHPYHRAHWTYAKNYGTSIGEKHF